MKKGKLTIKFKGIDEEGFDEVFAVGEQADERFIYTVEDKRLERVIVTDAKGERIAAETEKREYKNDVLLSFVMPEGGATATAEYAVSEDRTRLTIDLSGVREALSDVPSYFYSGMEDVNGDTNDLDEGKTYYYDAFDDLTFVLRLKRDAGVTLCMNGEEYEPESKKEKRIDGRTVYEYTFGKTDDYDPACRNRKPISLRAPAAKITFKFQ